MIPLPDLLKLCGTVGGLAAAVALAGLAAMHVLRRRSIATMLAIVAVVTVVATLAGVVATAAEMFISTHDRTVMFLLVGSSALVGLLVALLLARQIGRGSGALRIAVRTAAGTGRYTAPSMPLPGELAELSDELRSAYQRLSAAAERERALEAGRRDLVAWVSHDLRTPLAGLRAMAESLEDRVVDDPRTVDRYHRQIRREVDRLTDMVNDLFELARIHAGALPLSQRSISLTDLLAETLASTDPLARAKGVVLRGAAPPDRRVEVDADELGRALRNLVVNAIRHTPSEGTVQITGHVAPDAAYLTVTDACGGIPDEDLPRLFDVAFRGSAARTPGPDQGAGLGLAIARGIVEAHAGQIGVRNTGGGCQFEVRLPLH